jgi:hypothetical protein
LSGSAALSMDWRLATAARRLKLNRKINSVNGLLLLGKITKYVATFPFINTLLLTVSESSSRLLGLLGLFSLVLVGLALSLNIAFGAALPLYFASFSSSMFYILSELAGGGSGQSGPLGQVLRVSPGLGTCLVALMLFWGKFVLPSLLFAIIAVSLVKTRAAVVDRVIKQCGAPASLRLMYPGQQHK